MSNLTIKAMSVIYNHPPDHENKISTLHALHKRHVMLKNFLFKLITVMVFLL